MMAGQGAHGLVWPLWCQEFLRAIAGYVCWFANPLIVMVWVAAAGEKATGRHLGRGIRMPHYASASWAMTQSWME